MLLFLSYSSDWADQLRGQGGADLGTAIILEFQPECAKDNGMASAINSLEVISHFPFSFYLLRRER